MSPVVPAKRQAAAGRRINKEPLSGTSHIGVPVDSIRFFSVSIFPQAKISRKVLPAQSAVQYRCRFV